MNTGMKELLLARHAKSSWDLSGLSDHDRPLNERGERDLPAIAAALKQRGVVPELVLSSTATRARDTARGLGEGLGLDEENLSLSPDLYLASPGAILRHIQSLDESLSSVLLVGHNPGMHEAVALLCPGEGVDHFPTLAVARLELDVEFWGEVDRGTGFLVELLTPKTLAE